MLKKACILSLIASTLLLSACAANKVPEQPYWPSVRKYKPQPVYSRMMWSHPPQPIPEQAEEKTLYLSPVIAFELPDSTLQEAITALAQTIGYRWDYPPQLADRSVSIVKTGSVKEILREVGLQAQVATELDHERRLVRVIDTSTIPQLGVQ